MASNDFSRIRDAELRGRLFEHLDGLTLCGVLPPVLDRGVVQEVAEAGGDVDDLADGYSANAGYLNVALRMLASQGILRVSRADDRVFYRANPEAAWETWIERSDAYASGRGWIACAEGLWNRTAEPLSGESREALEAALEAHALLDPDHPVEGKVRVHVEGAIAAPWLVAVGFAHGTVPIREPSRCARVVAGFHPSVQDAWHRVASKLGWEVQGELTATGLFFVSRAAAYGVTTSYARTLVWSEELIFGDGHHLWRTAPGESEIHVDRTLNVWGSGGAHGAYFHFLDEVVERIFNAPLEEQPAGICDMGCGNGALLLHLEEVVRTRTERGRHLAQRPLLLVGADYNAEALVATAAHFQAKGVRGNFLRGDIGDPDTLAVDLWELHGLRLSDMLNVRSFLDHNRVFNRPLSDRPRLPMGTGAFAFRGERLLLRDVEQSLLEHFLKWAPYVAQHGLLVIELHTVTPAQAAERLGGMPATAYDATHGLTDQYIVELPVFDTLAGEAGLEIVEVSSRTFPERLPATVSLRYFLA
jgi:hypothetical protein